MSRSRKPTPSYLKHKQSGNARAVWTDGAGVRHFRMLPGPFGSPESRTAFAKLQLEVAATPGRPPGATDGVSVNELLLAFLTHAAGHYRRADGTATHEVAEYKLVARHVRELYGHTAAADFGPLALKALRERFIAAGWCRTLVNQRVARVRRIFKWGASEELVPVTVPQVLGTVQGLLRGRTKVRESVPVELVADAVVNDTLPFLSRTLRGLVEFQRLTGCRPGEACAIRQSDLDMSEPVWVYRPAQHKTGWRGKSRSIAVGPKAQAVLQPFFTADAEAYLFSPVRAVAELHAARTEARQTPKYPSHLRRNEQKRRPRPLRAPAAMYGVTSYGHAIKRACDKAFPLPESLVPRQRETRRAWWARLTASEKAEVSAWRKRHHWHPNQLRHAFATQVRKGHGLEAAQVLLGHSRADVTQVYAKRNEQLAAAVAAEIG